MHSICNFFKARKIKNVSDDKLIKKENTLSETVAKLKCGSYMWGANDDAVCKSALACGEKRRKADMSHYIYDPYRLKQNLSGTGP